MNNLSLEVIISKNPKTLLIKDTSLFITDPENYLIEILSPVSTTWVTINVGRDFFLTLNASALGLCSVAHVSDLPNLADGIYEIKHSQKPNFGTQIHYYHMRVTNLQSSYNSLLCDLYQNQCSLNKSEFNDKKQKMLSILMDIKASVEMVETRHDKESGKSLYEKAKTDLNNLKNECSC